MKKQLILHVGIHKTGTTSIQSFLAMNYEQLINVGIFVPVEYFTYENKPTGLRDALMKEDSSVYLPILEDIISKSTLKNCNKIVISDEDFHHFALQQKSSIKILEKYFDIEIVMYLRRQDKFAESVYGFSVQWASTRFTMEPLEWFRKFPVLNYKWVIEQWESFFSAPQIKLRVYEEALIKKSVIKDFIDAMGLKIEGPWLYPTRDMSNITLNKYIIEFLRRTNHVVLTKKEFDLLKQFLMNESSIKEGPNAIFLTNEERKELIERAEQSNLYVAKKYFQRDYLFPELENIDVPETLSDKAFKRVLHEVLESKSCNSIGEKLVKQITINY